ncbi:MAG: tRNA (guanosine(37)-N1)-methyltransferase TrmD [Clostridia bacterium]|nr:tRNA (guanosine(37)-N1)-methyltransferase TrmD [Clostridia bacterium]MBR4662225.1 tRNA (guanosine(37)-N1)-methyltransferase TrmD [Clostridia bacterium]
MRIDVMTLFPEFVDCVLSESIIGRARKSGALDVRTHNIRDYSEDKNRRVDDTPYGGGKGMLMAAPPIYNCYSAIVEDPESLPREMIRTVYMSPRGKLLRQEDAKRLSGYGQIIILCGHYEGIDQRIIDEIIDEEISIGDYVLTGGEIPACILADAVGRLCPGVLSDPECFEAESLTDGLLEYPQYTRPPVFHGMEVPEVLLSGHHKNIDDWRHEKSVEITKERRPDLLGEDS